MFKVIGKEESFKVLTLAEAMNLAKHMNEFVTIKGTECITALPSFHQHGTTVTSSLVT